MMRRIPLLRGLAILAVLCNHAATYGLMAMIAWADRYRPVMVPNFDYVGTCSYWVLVAVHRLSLFAVPSFLFISGLSVAYAGANTSLPPNWKVFKARLMNLAIPYLVWSTLGLVADAVAGKVYPLAEYAEILLTGREAAGYGFVPVLFQLYLLSHWMIHWAKVAPKVLLGLSAALQVAVVVLPYLGGFWGASTVVHKTVASLSWLCIGWSFFFVLGIAVGGRTRQARRWLVRRKRGCLYRCSLWER